MALGILSCHFCVSCGNYTNNWQISDLVFIKLYWKPQNKISFIIYPAAKQEV